MGLYILKDDNVKQNCRNAVTESKYGTYVWFEEPTRTKPQERYFHHIIGIISKHTGTPKYHLKDEIKERVGYFDDIVKDGKQRRYLWPSEHITDEQYTKMIDSARMIAHFLEITLPPKTHYGLDNDR